MLNRIAVILLGLTLSVTRAQAQTGTPPAPDLSHLSLEELTRVGVATVNGASKFDQKVTSAPSWVTVIGADEIRLYGYRTLADVLQSVPGFYVNNDRNYSYLGVRGFGRLGDYNDHFLLLIDGHRLNDAVYGESLIGTEFPLDIDLISRVEIIRGPGSALYGANAVFAVVNVITKRGRDIKGAEVSVGAASLQTFGERVTFGRQWSSGPELLLSGSLYNSAGVKDLYFPEFDSPATNNGIAVNADGVSSGNLFARLEYGGFSLQGLYGSRTKVIPTGSFGTVFNDPRTRTTDTDGYFDLQYQHHFRNHWQLLVRIGYDQTRYRGVYVYDTAGTGVPPYTLNEDLSAGDRWSTALDLSKSFGKHRLTLGAETQFNIREDQSNYDQNPHYSYTDSHHSSTIPAVYVQDEFSILRNLTLSAGIRADHFGAFGFTANPRVGLIYTPRVRTALKLLYGTAFRAPNDYELYYAAPPNEVSNETLQPETIRTTEVVLEQYVGRHFRFAVAGFYNDIRSLISEQTDPSNGLLMYLNTDNVHAHGVDFEVAAKWRSGLQGRASYTFQRSSNQMTGDVLSNSPRQLAKLDLTIPVIPNRLYSGVEAQYRGNERTLDGDALPGYTIANVTLSTRESLHGWTVSASAYNLFAKRYETPVGPEFVQDSLSQNSRTIRLKITRRFGLK